MDLHCHGHDSEHQTDSKDMTSSGHPRNFITGNTKTILNININTNTNIKAKSNRFLVAVHDDPVTGRGIMGESILFRTGITLSIVINIIIITIIFIIRLYITYYKN